MSRRICINKSSLKKRRNEGMFSERNECLQVGKHRLYHWKYDMSVCIKSTGQGMNVCMNTYSDCIKISTGYITRANMYNNSIPISIILMHICKETIYRFFQSIQLWVVSLDGNTRLKGMCRKTAYM